MTTFLLSLVPASLFIYAVNILFQDDHLLEKRGEWARNNWPEWVTKPLFDCAICMSSIWGSAWFFIGLVIGFDLMLPIKLWIPYVFCLCGLNTIINKLTSKERVIIDE